MKGMPTIANEHGTSSARLSSFSPSGRDEFGEKIRYLKPGEEVQTEESPQCKIEEATVVIETDQNEPPSKKVSPYPYPYPYE